MQSLDLFLINFENELIAIIKNLEEPDFNDQLLFVYF